MLFPQPDAGKRSTTHLWAVFIAYVLLLLSQCMCVPLRPFDEPLWYRRCCRWPTEVNEPWLYKIAIDVPALNRWLYGGALRLCGLTGLPCPKADYSVSEKRNLTEGRIAPWEAVMVMRSVNVLSFVGAVLPLYVVAWLILRSRAWAVVALLPLAFSKNIVLHIVPRVGPDALLAFTLSATLAAWVAWHLKGEGTTLKAVILLGALAGLATGTKLNGGLLVLAFCAYLVTSCKGWQRLWKPILAGASAFVAFSLINPVVIMGRAPFYQVLVDMVRRRFVVIAGSNERAGPMSFIQFANSALPTWPMLPALAAGFIACRREGWFPPVAWWTAFLTLGTFFGINRPFPRYLGPLEIGLYFPAALCISFLASRAINKNRRTPQPDNP